MSHTHSMVFKPEDACWYNPARSAHILAGCGVYGIPSHFCIITTPATVRVWNYPSPQRNWHPGETDPDNTLSVRFTGILSYETVTLMELWLCHSTWCLGDNNSFLLLLQHAGRCGAVARRAAVTLMDRFHFLRWAQGLDYAAVLQLKPVRGCPSSCAAPSQHLCCQVPAGRSSLSHQCTALCFPNGAFRDLLPIFLLDYLFSYCWVWVSLWTKVLCWVSVLQVLSPHLWLFFHLLNRALHRVQVFNSGEVQLIYFLNRLCFGYQCLKMLYVTNGHKEFLLKFYNFTFYI